MPVKVSTMNSTLQAFFEYILQSVSLTDEMKYKIAMRCEVKTYKKGEILLKEGSVCRHLFFIEKGVLRTFSYQDGKDVTSWIYFDNQLFTSWGSYLTQSPSLDYIVVEEAATILTISHDTMEQLYEELPQLERFGRKVLEAQVAFVEAFSREYNFAPAKQRYEMLLEYFPDITQRVNLGHVASFLGISQETLSRIRKR